MSRRSALFASRESIKEKARLRLREFDVGDRFSHLPLPKASVLLPLMVREGKLHLLLTLRSMQVGERGPRPAVRGAGLSGGRQGAKPRRDGGRPHPRRVLPRGLAQVPSLPRPLEPCFPNFSPGGVPKGTSGCFYTPVTSLGLACQKNAGYPETCDSKR